MVKGANRDVKFILMIFARKHLNKGDWVTMNLKVLCPQNSGSAFNNLFMILHNERGEEVHEN